MIIRGVLIGLATVTVTGTAYAANGSGGNGGNSDGNCGQVPRPDSLRVLTPAR